MLVPAASFSDAVLGLHILAVVVAFGATFSYPVLAAVGNRQRRAMPALHRAQLMISQRVIGPGLAVVLLAGIYLASHEHQWSHFYVQWGLGAVIVLGAVEGAVMIPRERRLSELSERDVARLQPVRSPGRRNTVRSSVRSECSAPCWI